MCTLTYVPNRDRSATVTSNRDEDPERETSLKPEVREHNGVEVLFPRDKRAGGTWIAASKNGRLHCLLNGAFNRHDHNPPYRKSRGIVLLDSLLYSSLEHFVENYRLDGIEPFTLVSFGSDREKNGEELRYDSRRTYLDSFSLEEPRIWSSAQLYKPEVIKEREGYFRELIDKDRYPSPDNMLEFHKFGGSKDPWNAFVMNRNDKVKTVSITQVILSSEEISMRYIDRVSNSTSTARI